MNQKEFIILSINREDVADALNIPKERAKRLRPKLMQELADNMLAAFCPDGDYYSFIRSCVPDEMMDILTIKREEKKP